MFTKRLYFENAYIKEFDARVLSCEEGKNGYEIVLDETAFFPEGGGQPADQGYLEDGEVTDVRDKKIMSCISALNTWSRELWCTESSTGTGGSFICSSIPGNIFFQGLFTGLTDTIILAFIWVKIL